MNKPESAYSSYVSKAQVVLQLQVAYEVAKAEEESKHHKRDHLIQRLKASRGPRVEWLIPLDDKQRYMDEQQLDHDLYPEVLLQVDKRHGKDQSASTVYHWYCKCNDLRLSHIFELRAFYHVNDNCANFRLSLLESSSVEEVTDFCLECLIAPVVLLAQEVGKKEGRHCAVDGYHEDCKLQARLNDYDSMMISVLLQVQQGEKSQAKVGLQEKSYAPIPEKVVLNLFAG